MGCVGQLLVVYKLYNTVHAIKLEPMTKIFTLDENGDGEVSRVGV
jgi:hypothetical protein